MTYYSNDPTTDDSSSTGGRSRRKRSRLERLYVGNGAFDIVGKRKRFYAAFGVLVLACALLIGIRGFNFGIEFQGGTQIQLPAASANGSISESDVRAAFAGAIGTQPESVQVVGAGNAASIQIRAKTLSNAQVAEVKQGLFDKLKPLDSSGRPSQRAISDSAVSASWGGEISQQAFIGLGIFLVLVAAFLTFYFERWMAVAALIALVHDLVVTAGIYSLIGFEVTPATVIGLLTILGFSLYDTVVVFDKIRENTRGLLGLTRRTYGEAANLAVNQTLMRSINTSLIALLPVAGLLVVGVGLLGVGTLADLALVQLVGLLAGAISSIFLATPLLVDMKMREQPYRQQAARVLARREGQAKRKATGRAAERAEDDAAEIESAVDDEAVRAEQRRERAMAAAASAPARPGKQPTARRRQSTGKGSRPSGKKRR